MKKSRASAETEEGAKSSSPEPLRPVLDPRRHAYRPDLAARALADRVKAPRYVEGKTFQVVRPAVPLRREPDAGRGLDTEALFGETVTLYDEKDGWAWVQLLRDRYVGYVPVAALTDEVLNPTHRVRSIGTFVYPAPDIKSPPMMHLSINALVTVAAGDSKFCRLETGGFLVSRHLVEVNRHVRDFVEIAESLLGAPYLWGGRTRIGLDCSGLVQLSLEAAGVSCPRDSDMQQDELGKSVMTEQPTEGLERGDLVFWNGHVGVMADGLMLVHANAHHMAVTVETLPEATGRISKTGSEITAVKRLPARAG